MQYDVLIPEKINTKDKIKRKKTKTIERKAKIIGGKSSRKKEGF